MKVKFLWQKSLFFIIFILTLALFVTGAMESKQALQSSDLIRLQVIANSDSFEDQDLKRRIRDRIIDELGNTFKENTDVVTARNVITKELKKIEKIAEEEMVYVGKDYNVKANLGNFPFPTKMYGNFVLPAGKYEALRVILGDGQGANWWCVLFPPLCFVDITTSVAEEPAMGVTEKTSETKEITIKFKIIEFIKNIFA